MREAEQIHDEVQRLYYEKWQGKNFADVSDEERMEMLEDYRKLADSKIAIHNEKKQQQIKEFGMPLGFKNEKDYPVGYHKTYNGIIIITDPCYLLSQEFQGSPDEKEYEWMEYLERNVKSLITYPSGMGDIDFSIVDEYGKPQGGFCMDSGTMCVADLEDVKAHDKYFTELKGHCFTAFFFNGKVEFEDAGPDPECEGFHKPNKMILTWEDGRVWTNEFAGW
jgi:hypothetical protein